MALTIVEIVEVLETRGKEKYGREAVSQLEHALQCAHLAELAHEPPDLVAACLLHDLGHLMSTMPDEFNHTQDDVHQHLAVPFLSGVFNSAVIDPIRMHVEAKRYLCQAQPGYWDTLSRASKDSLVLQGGPHSEAQAQQFIAQPQAQAAVRLRRYDDLAKVQGAQTPLLSHYAQVLRTVAARAFA
jgi:phosphonate degradation associated HDIG domain protein